MKTLLLVTLLMATLTVSASEVLDDHRGTRFELSKLVVNSGDYKASCGREAIQDNTFANDANMLRPEHSLLVSRYGYFFDDKERCHALTFNIVVIKEIDYQKSELTLGLYLASWGKEFGFKPIKLGEIFNHTQVKAKCSISKVGYIFKDTVLTCPVENNLGENVGLVEFTER